MKGGSKMDYVDLSRQLLNNFLYKAGDESHRWMSQMTRGEHFVMYHLAFNNATQPGKMATALGVSTAHMAKVLRGLEEKGFIQRELDLSDRRKIIVTLTTLGTDAFRVDFDASIEKTAELLRALGEEDALALVRIFNRITALNQS